MTHVPHTQFDTTTPDFLSAPFDRYRALDDAHFAPKFNAVFSSGKTAGKTFFV